jgi:hypothetical protein
MAPILLWLVMVLCLLISVVHEDAIGELTACFSEPRIGSVGGRVGVRNPNDSVITGIQSVIYYSAFQLYKIPENWTRSV